MVVDFKNVEGEVDKPHLIYLICRFPNSGYILSVFSHIRFGKIL